MLLYLRMRMSITPPTVTVFLSHSSKDVDKARLVKEVLEKHRIKTIIFTEDIKSGLWRNEISHVIETSDFFVVLLTENYHASDYTDHEFGMALKSEAKILVVLESNTNLYGFIEQYQASVNCQIIDEDSANNLTEIILEESDLDTKTLNFFIDQISKSKSHLESEYCISEIKEHQKFTDKQLEHLVHAYSNNDNVTDAPNVLDAIMKILDKNLSHISSSLQNQLNDLNQYKPKGTVNELDTIISKGEMYHYMDLYKLGVECANSGNHKDAIYYYDQSIDIDSYNYETHAAMGASYKALGKLDKAKKCFELAEFLEADLMKSCV